MKLLVKHIDGVDVFKMSDAWSVVAEVVGHSESGFRPTGSLIVKYQIGDKPCKRIYAGGVWRIWEQIPE